MKKILLLFAGISLSLVSSAQYFGHDYTPYGTIGNGGVTRTLPAPGHFITGVGPVGSGNGVNLVTTDTNGNVLQNITISYDWGAGQIEITNALGVAPLPQDTSPVSVMFSYRYLPPGSSSFHCGIAFFSKNIVATKGGTFAGTVTALPPLYSITVTGVSKYQIPSGPPTSTEYLLTGQIRTMTEETYIFSIRFEPLGRAGVGFVYKINTPQTSFVMPKDIIYNPYNDQYYIVGSISFPGQPASTTDAFCLTLNASDGSVIKCERYDAGEYDGFNAIAESKDPADPGFILTGYAQSDPGQASRAWVVKTDLNNQIVWSNTYESPDTGPFTTGNDVMGRLNTTGTYEYYVAGQKGVPGAMDALAIKLDASGNVFPQGMGAYGILFDDTYAASVDMKDNGPGVGISYYMSHANTQTMVKDAHIRKAYFNGKSGCVESFHDGIAQARNVTITPLPASIIGSYAPEYIGYLSGQNNTDNSICYASTIPGGSNARPAGIADMRSPQHIHISPNPATDVLDYELDNDFDLTGATLLITNLQGQVLLRKKVMRSSGQVPVSGLPAGLYFIEFRNGEASAVLKFVKQ